MAATFNLTHIRGDDHSISVTYTDRGDITGATITYSVKDKPDGTEMFNRTVGTGITITNAANGVFRIDIVPANTNDKKAGLYRHGCRVAVGGKSDTVFAGNFTLNAETV